jgi:hypothetical protein
MGTSVVSYWEKPSPLQPCLAVAAFCWVKNRAPVTPAGFSLGYSGRKCRRTIAEMSAMFDRAACQTQVTRCGPAAVLAHSASQRKPVSAL